MKKVTNRKRVGHKTVEELIKKHDYENYSWMSPKNIVVSQWVRVKCTFGCRFYGKGGACPPNLPSVGECRAFFNEYKSGILFHFPKRVEKPEDRHVWTRQVNLKLLKLEREVFLSGYYKTFLLFMDSCELCESCPGSREKCLNPKQSRPSPEGMAIDVFATVRKLGYPIHVLKDTSEEMNRYAILLIE